MSSQSSKPLHLVLRCLALIVLGLVLLKLAFYHFQLITYAFPSGFREGAVLLNTQLILDGGNPYTLENQPLYTNVYGIFYHLAIYSIARIFGASLLVHRAFTGCFIVASALLVFFAARRCKASYFLSLTGFLIFYAQLLTQGTPLASPDSLGLFLFLSSLFIPWKFQYSSTSLLVSIFLGTLGFLTKPYFIISLVYLAFYLIVISRKKAFQYTVGCSLSLASSIFIMNHFYPMYFTNTFFIHATVASNTPDHLVKQLQFYGIQNFPMIAIVILILASQINIFVSSSRLNQKDNRKPNIKQTEISFLTRLSVLLQSRTGLFTFCLVFSLLIFCLKTGQHEGNWQVYIHHLISPFLIVLAITTTEKLPKKTGITLLLINLLFVSSVFQPKLNYETRNWEAINSLILNHQNIFNSPAIVPLLMQQNKQIYDGGQSEYFGFGANRKLFGIPLAPDLKVKLRDEQYKQEITTSVQQKKFDLILIAKEYPGFLSKELVKQYYTLQQTLNADMPVRSTIDWWRQWTLEAYLPKQ